MVMKCKLFAVIILGLVLSAGCAMHTRPLFDYSPDGEKIMVKRYPKRPNIDFTLRWRSKAYVKNNSELKWMLSDDQKNIIEQYGQPDYIRRTFYSRRRDMVKEWIYWEKQKVFQFVRGTLVFEGPLTDLERTLVTYGYPRKAIIEQLDGGIERITFYYKSPFTIRHRTISFSNDKIIYSQEIK